MDKLGATPEIAAALAHFQEDLIAAAGKNLAGLILYGGLARGRYRPGKSDINVVVLLHDVSAAALEVISPILRAARRAANVSPMILSPNEVQPAAVVFPTKFLDMKDHHVVLHGEDPFTALEVPREQIRLRIVQELRNLTLRLRRRLIDVLDDPELLAAALAETARPLAIELTALLRLVDKPVLEDDRSAVVFEAAASAFGADREALAQLAQLRHAELTPVGIVDDSKGLQRLADRILGALPFFTDYAERLKGGTS
ncbi:MAG: hypothetical protein L0Y72_02040 [Gemmataceae bacterium]|nr:hypothetical protein [Gemmataceae bacterium]MCI0737797.1 hypothetical protein [Gemmataceae bacterium]